LGINQFILELGINRITPQDRGSIIVSYRLGTIPLDILITINFSRMIGKSILDYFSYHLENHQKLKTIGKLKLVQTIATSQIKRCDALTPQGA
jgi:hypothetical protein